MQALRPCSPRSELPRSSTRADLRIGSTAHGPITMTLTARPSPPQRNGGLGATGAGGARCPAGGGEPLRSAVDAGPHHGALNSRRRHDRCRVTMAGGDRLRACARMSRRQRDPDRPRRAALPPSSPSRLHQAGAGDRTSRKSSAISPVSSHRISEIGIWPAASNSAMKRLIVNASPSWRRRSARSRSIWILPVR